MSVYDFHSIENKWQKIWEEQKSNRAQDDTSRQKCYVLDMFPYPSGAGLHVGHPLGYIASDIYARYKRLKGFNVLHPIGFDAFGLPAEQYAIEHGVHPKVSTQKNIENFRQQLRTLALSFDWDRELSTCDPDYYKWTQWIFIRLYESWYNRGEKKAMPIHGLISIFEKEGNLRHPIPQEKHSFSAEEWKSFDEETQYKILMNYRLAYLSYTDVNWCEALGTVLANDEVVNGLSYRGGHPVTKKKMLQWSLRITEYAERLLEGLNKIDFSHSLKEIQKNWIGKSIGAEIVFQTENSATPILVFTTRPDTIFGVDFMVLAPEHSLVQSLTHPEKSTDVANYLTYVQQRSEVERMSEVKKITGCFLGTYAIHPITGKKLPIWISEYVLAHYGTGAIMAVPAGDQRDFSFAKHFHIPISNIFGTAFDGERALENKNTTLQNSDFLNGKVGEQAIELAIEQLEHLGVGKRKVNYKMRDAGWSRQRYWGEPFPLYFSENGRVCLMDEKELPLELPPLDKFQPSKTGEGPLSHATAWLHPQTGQRRDTNTMPTHAGAAWYFLRFADPHNSKAFADRKMLDYWNQVDVYVGGAEHAVAHLLYARLWVKVLYDLGYLSFDEPFKKLINQGKIMGDTRFVYRVRGTQQFVSHDLKDGYETDELRVDVSLVNGFVLDTEAFKKWRPDFLNATFILNTKNEYLCGNAVEKMSKSYFNVVNPDHIINSYGADTLRMYEMFLGPFEDSKPWDTKNIEGTHRFLKKLWNWLHPETTFQISDEKLNKEEEKVLHQLIKKIQDDIENFSFNTAVSAFMTAMNAIYKLECRKRAFFEPLIILLSSFTPHIAEELWQKMGKQDSVLKQAFPEYSEEMLKEDHAVYVLCINGKKRAEINLSADLDEDQVKQVACAHPNIQKWLEETPAKKVIVVKHKMVNFVC